MSVTSATPRSWLLLPAGISLLAGLTAALALGGLPSPAPSLADGHGLFMVVGFLATLIALERSVALRESWGYCAPALLGGGALTLIVSTAAGLSGIVPLALLLLGSLALMLVYQRLHVRNRDPLVAVQSTAAGLLALALLQRFVFPTSQIVWWLAGFIVVTIAAERVELARLAMPSWGAAALAGWTAALLAALTSSLLAPAVAVRIIGGLLLVLVAGLVVHDVARRTIRLIGLPRLSAGALLAGYLWLAVTGVTLLLIGDAREGYGYDIAVHACFLGFAMSMIIAHAPVILPAVLGIKLPYRPVMWLPLALLHGTLAVRVVSAISHARGWWQLGLGGTVVSVLTFVLVSAGVAVTAGRTR